MTPERRAEIEQTMGWHKAVVELLTALDAAAARAEAAESALKHIHDVASDTANWVSDMGIHVILTTCRDALGIDDDYDATRGGSE